MAELWVPDQVVDGHKRWATCVWCTLLGSMATYTTWSVYNTIQLRNNPSVNLRIKDDRYTFPDLSMCFNVDENGGHGCDSRAFDCAGTVDIRVRNSTGFVDVPASDIAVPNELFPANCVDARLSNLTLDPLYDGEDEETELNVSPEVSLKISWITSRNDSEITLRQISESVWVHLTEADASTMGDETTVVGEVAYTRIPSNTTATTIAHSTLNMELTETIDFSGGTSKSFSAAMTRTTIQDPFGDLSGPASEANVGLLLLDVHQPRLSWQIQEEVDPVQWSVIVGNIGGAWEIILVIWGVLFVVAHRSGPHLKPRNFWKTAKRGRERLVLEVSKASSKTRRLASGRRAEGQGLADAKEQGEAEEKGGETGHGDTGITGARDSAPAAERGGGLGAGDVKSVGVSYQGQEGGCVDSIREAPVVRSPVQRQMTRGTSREEQLHA